MRFCKALLPVLLVAISDATAYGTDDSSNLTPHIHGTVRARYELEPDDMDHRFQIRNARLSVSGNVSTQIDYFVQADLCDRGSIKMLDAWGGFKPASWIKIQAGQQRMPFSIDATRAPHQLLFANRSFIGKQMGNVRAVGLKGRVEFPGTTAYVDAGIFNTHGLTDQITWDRTYTYSGKAGCVVSNVKAEVGMESVRPDSIRANLWDCSLSWTCGRWLVEGEYMGKHFVHKSFRTSHAYYLMTDYHMPFSKGMFDQVSFQGRWDAMTDHSNGKRDSAGQLYCTDRARNRITAGATLSCIRSSHRADLKLNYEKYFYHQGVEAPKGDRDKITVELVVRF